MSAEKEFSKTNIIPDTAPEDDEDSMEAFMARVREMYAGLEKEGDRIVDIYNTQDSAAAAEAVQELAMKIAKNDYEFLANIQKLREAGPDERKRGPISARQRQIIENYKRIIINQTGLPDEARFSEIEQAKMSIDQTLSKHFDNSDYTPSQALERLGVVAHDRDGKRHYFFPDTYMPPSVVEKWEIYLASVCKHTLAMKALEDSVVNDPDLNDAVTRTDTLRSYAHDSVTTDIHAVLGLEGRNGWTKKDTRELLGHIRDEIFPTQESERGADAIRRVRSCSRSLDAVFYLTERTHQ